MNTVSVKCCPLDTLQLLAYLRAFGLIIWGSCHPSAK